MPANAASFATVSGVTASRTLPSLLHTSLSWLELVYADQGFGRGGMPSLDEWANLLRVLDLVGIERRDLQRRTRLSRRALRSRVSAATRREWAEELSSRRGQGIIRLTGKGAEVVARLGTLQQAAEDAWRRQVGSETATALFNALARVVAELPLEHPHYPASYGTIDASVAGGPGQDWKPVPRQDGATVAGLSMCALLSQALVGFALEYEERSQVALSVTTSILRQIPSQGRPLHEVGMSSHLSTMERHGFVRIVSESDNRAVFLTTKGRAVNDAYMHRIEAVEHAWRERSGDETVSTLRKVLENVADHAALDRRGDASSRRRSRRRATPDRFP
jgi:hypothetical protein